MVQASLPKMRLKTYIYVPVEKKNLLIEDGERQSRPDGVC